MLRRFSFRVNDFENYFYTKNAEISLCIFYKYTRNLQKSVCSNAKK